MKHFQFWKKNLSKERLEITASAVQLHRGWNETPEIAIHLTVRKYGILEAYPTKLVGSLKVKDYFFQILCWRDFTNHNTMDPVSWESDRQWVLICPITEAMLNDKAGDFYLEIQAEYLIKDVQKMLFYNTTFEWTDIVGVQEDKKVR